MKNTVPVNATALPSTRRSILRGLAALPAVSMPVVAVAARSEPDPIFAAIKRHKVADAALAVALKVDDGQGPDVPATGDATLEALYALVETVPTTLPGLATFAEYIDGLVEGGDWECAGWAMTAIGKACRTMLGGAA